MGERTLVDTNVRDTWEMDAAEVSTSLSSPHSLKTFVDILYLVLNVQVSFDNPAWKNFIDRVVQEVCERLGVNIAASRPRCELYKLLLYETGSQ